MLRELVWWVIGRLSYHVFILNSVKSRFLSSDTYYAASSYCALPLLPIRRRSHPSSRSKVPNSLTPRPWLPLRDAVDLEFKSHRANMHERCARAPHP